MPFFEFQEVVWLPKCFSFAALAKVLGDNYRNSVFEINIKIVDDWPRRVFVFKKDLKRDSTFGALCSESFEPTAMRLIAGRFDTFKKAISDETKCI